MIAFLPILAVLTMSPKVASQQPKALATPAVTVPPYSVTVGWFNRPQPGWPVVSNGLAIWPVVGGATNWFWSLKTTSAVVTAPSNTVNIQAFALAAPAVGQPMLSGGSNIVTNNVPPPAQLQTNVYRVQPMFSPDLVSWSVQGPGGLPIPGWTFTNLNAQGSGFWRLALTPN